MKCGCAPNLGRANRLRRCAIPRRHSPILCAATGIVAPPFIDGRKSVPSTALANMCANIGVSGTPTSANSMPHHYDRQSLQRSASLSVSEPLWGCYRTLDIRSHRCLQSIIRVMLAWARDTTDFRPDVAKRGRRCLREPAHGLRAWPRAIARRGRAFIAPQDFGPLGRCTHIGVGARRDRFSSIDKRRCDCAAGRAQAAGVSARDGAPAQAVCRLPRSGKLALQLAPVACTHECNSHLCTLMTPQTVRDCSRDGFHGQFARLTRECRARATCRVHTRTRSGTSTSCNESRPLALRDEETAAAVTRDTAQQTNAGAI